LDGVPLDVLRYQSARAAPASVATTPPNTASRFYDLDTVLVEDPALGGVASSVDGDVRARDEAGVV
jgi:hypothetical protein